ncbi:MAG: hypothetical protein EXX96DRAFT_564068 [Benjaminiella poitrasii]|nr:MAG: hypothetical protein EXX96DRAFT_564068 [Benjaminiella poitrasii]
MPGTTSESSQQPLETSFTTTTNNADQTSDPGKADLLNLDKNEDYQSVLKALDILKHQLTKASKDIETLHSLKTKAVEDPYSFISTLKKKSKSKVPTLQKVISVPAINWNKYRFLPESRLVQQNAAINNLTQQFSNQVKKSTYCSILDTTMATEYTIQPSTPVATAAKSLQQELVKATQALHQIPSCANSVSDFSEDEDNNDGSMAQTTSSKTTPSKRTMAGKGKGRRRISMVQIGTERDFRASSMDISETESPIRSRLQSIEPRTPDENSNPINSNPTDDPNYTPTFKQPWTDEEQKRLEELLIVYPDEPVQAQRFNKISKALGTRTPRQVASRVQKYFIKLAKMGLPVPGRITIPPSCMPKNERSSSTGHHKSKVKNKSKSRGNHGRVTKAASTPPMLRTSGIGYNSLVSGGLTNTRISGAHYAMSHGPPAVFMSDDEEDSSVNEMMRSVNNEGKETSDIVIHEGYACDGCGTEPIVGVRYKCTVCDVSEEVDLCSSCMEKGTFINDHHTLEHTFEAVRTANPLPYYADNDYKPTETLGEYSYLGF